MKKKILTKLVPVIVFLLIIIIILGINVYKTDRASQKMLEYLNKEYDCQFKINLITHDIYFKPLFNFDGAENKSGDESFSYKITSLEDNTSFKAFYYIKKDGTESFYDSYEEYKYFSQKNNEILEYTQSLINNINEDDYDLKINNDYTYFVNNYHLLSTDNLDGCLRNIEYVDNLINIRDKVFNDLKNDENLISNKRNNFSTLQYEIEITYNDDWHVVMNDEGVFILNEKKTIKYEIHTYVKDILKIEVPIDEVNINEESSNISEDGSTLTEDNNNNDNVDEINNDGNNSEKEFAVFN